MMTHDRMHIYDLFKKSGLAELILLELENQRRECIQVGKKVMSLFSKMEYKRAL